MTPWRPIVAYRDFWDVPRMFDCPFDEALDEYPDTYRVSLLEPTTDLTERADWSDLRGRVLGSVQLAELEFDESRRARVRWDQAVSQRWTAGKA